MPEASPASRVVDDDAALGEVVATMAGLPTYAVDTEFHRERTYFPELALVQLSWPGACVLVDPLAVDVAALGPVLAGGGVAVMHAARQDLEVLGRACLAVPSTLFDTQRAAGFLGFSTPSLGVLADRVLGVRLSKASRMTDWMRRPLSEGQRAYAAADVAHLLDLAAALRAELAATGRLAWAEEECEELRSGAWGPTDPDRAWLRLKGGRHLEGRARGVAQAVAAWRERRAMALDRPVRAILADPAVVGIANRAPRTLRQLRQVRGVEGRHLDGDAGQELLGAVEVGRGLGETDLALARGADVEEGLRPVVTLVATWLAQLGGELGIDPGLVASRDDLCAFLAGEPTARLATGWRASVVGPLVRRIADGDLAVAVDGGRALVLERRSGDPVRLDLPRPTVTWAGGR
ncbi:MAG: ribonuclease D [Acidimicrobiales bacterium]